MCKMNKKQNSDAEKQASENLGRIVNFTNRSHTTFFLTKKTIDMIHENCEKSVSIYSGFVENAEGCL